MISILHIIIALSVFFNSLIIHELGHFFYFKWFLKKDVVIRFMRGCKGYNFVIGYPLDYIEMNKQQKLETFIAGIFAGLIPLLLIFYWNIVYGLLILPYLVCCIPDFKNIWRLVKNG